MEVPGDVAGDLLIGVARQELIQRRLVVALDGNLGEQIKRNVELVRAEGLDLAVGARLLIAEVVGWEGQDPKALVLVLAIDRLQTGVRGLGEPSLAGYVDDQTDLSTILGQFDVVSVDVLDGEIVE